nr:unnamed protein product [Callosobruchus analis]
MVRYGGYSQRLLRPRCRAEGGRLLSRPRFVSR